MPPIHHKRHFITSSEYEGAWNDDTLSMDGFGRYVYPDGTEYRGYFRNGKFHGFGRLRLPLHKFVISGHFIDGTLTKIESMAFTDGLTVKTEGISVKLDTWKYCSAHDRRYALEILFGIPGVGPDAFLTCELQTRKLPIDAYDIGEGVFLPRTGFVSQRPPPYSPQFFIGCDERINWIQENCRYRSFSSKPTEPSLEHRRQIIENNLPAEIELEENEESCLLCQSMARKLYFPKLCDGWNDSERSKTNIDKAAPKATPYEIEVLPALSRSSSCPSFSEISLKTDIAAALKPRDNYMIFGRTLSEESIVIKPRAQSIIHPATSINF